MHISQIRIENYKAIALLELDQLSKFVLIAGPNGIGKSCILDAIRILKSHHGGYVPNEIDQLYGEFQLDTTEPQRLRPLFRDVTRPITIAASFTLMDDERAYIRANLASILNDYVWRERIGRQTGDNTAMYQQRLLIASANQELARQVDEDVAHLTAFLHDSLDAATWTAKLSIQYGGIPVSESDLLLRVVFALYAPQHVGVIDYHSANRNYAREAVGGLSVNFSSTAAFGARGEQSLYNTAGKYQNIKAEMIDAYVRDLIRKDVGVDQEGAEDPPDLAASLEDLFATFFPDKSFHGMKMNTVGVPEFPVTVRGGTHDLNELSSGEKEILFGYLRLRTSTPRNSIILMDEPELHLNPALLTGLPAFYNRHIGQARNNQLVLVTHSDAILRPVVGSDDYMLVHLSPPSEVDGVVQNQASLVRGQDEFERTLIALVGDVATYKPDAKYLLVEGGDNTGIDAEGFDRMMISALFPEFARRVNILGGGERTRVERLLELLEDAGLQKEFGHRLFAIVDHDSFDAESRTVMNPNYSQWDRYHIENYLLDDDSIARVMARVTMQDVSPIAVSQAVEEAAAELVENLAYQATRKEVNREVVSCINLGRTASKTEPTDLLVQTLSSSMSRLAGVVETLGKAQIDERYGKHKARYNEALSDGSWRAQFPGRDILKRFVNKAFAGKFSYEYFRNSVISDMAQNGLQPEGMRTELIKVDRESFE